MVDADRGYAHVEIQSVAYSIDGEAIGSFLCQDCLDAFTKQYFEDERTAEIAVIDLSSREIRPLVESSPWFTFGNYAVSCTLEETGTVKLLIHYCPPRFQSESQSD